MPREIALPVAASAAVAQYRSVKWLLATAGIFQLASCDPTPNPQPFSAPISEQTFREAARHCHSKEIIRMQPGALNTFYVGGLVPIDPRKAARIECVRRYLGVPEKDGIVLLS